MKFEWDEAKNTMNIEKHGIDFNDVCELFHGDRITIPDTRMDYGEDRFITFGHLAGRLVVVIYTQRPPRNIRIISVRKANDREKERFDKTIKV